MSGAHLIFDLDGTISDPAVGILRSINYALKSFGYAEIVESMQLFRSHGARLGVCTSKRVDLAEKVLSMFNLRDYFEFVSGGDVGVAKSDQLSSLLAQGSVGANSSMIGDRAVDVIAAKRNLLWSVGVLWGHGSEAELTSAGADQLLSNPVDLEWLLETK